jgi:hypothetical protein
MSLFNTKTWIERSRSLSRRRGSWAALACLAIAGYAVHGARADIPAQNALVYTGTLTDAAGRALSSPQNVRIALYDAATDGNLVCERASASTNLDPNGRFQVTMPDLCAAAVAASPDLWVEVSVAGGPLGRAKIGAAPYALEAGNASKLESKRASDFQQRVGGTCAAGSSIRAIGADGTVTCQADTNTTYTGASGVTVSGTSVSADTSYLQRRVSGTCAAPSSIRAVNADGTVTCQSGLPTCPADRILKTDEVGAWVCSLAPRTVLCSKSITGLAQGDRGGYFDFSVGDCGGQVVDQNYVGAVSGVSGCNGVAEAAIRQPTAGSPAAFYIYITNGGACGPTSTYTLSALFVRK